MVIVFKVCQKRTYRPDQILRIDEKLVFMIMALFSGYFVIINQWWNELSSYEIKFMTMHILILALKIISTVYKKDEQFVYLSYHKNHSYLVIKLVKLVTKSLYYQMVLNNPKTIVFNLYAILNICEKLYEIFMLILTEIRCFRIEAGLKRRIVRSEPQIEMKCAICLKKMKEHVVLRCRHEFHMDCLAEWFIKSLSCPLCRSYAIF
ncbi:RING-H2 finger protein ATL32 [Thelohanellus kitauei]|uniref:RING-H2 finger protein ATL32 n=1 Tax=Thelohanellus kitauei TaxID=669202 RepID=A0A0C2IVW9_THEKT|nr:RING-H2 finger protein ATL32 [Thelohanellus kitauei]